MNVYDLEEQATPGPWGHAAGVVTCVDDGEHIGSFHTNTLAKSLPEQHRMNGPASAQYAAHCRNHFMEALKAYKRLVQSARNNGCMFLFSEDHDAIIAKLEEV